MTIDLDDPRDTPEFYLDHGETLEFDLDFRETPDFSPDDPVNNSLWFMYQTWPSQSSEFIIVCLNCKTFTCINDSEPL